MELTVNFKQFRDHDGRPCRTATMTGGAWHLGVDIVEELEWSKGTAVLVLQPEDGGAAEVLQEWKAEGRTIYKVYNDIEARFVAFLMERGVR